MLWLSHSQFPGSGPQAGSQSRKSPSCLCQLHRAYLSGQTLPSRFQGTAVSPQADRAQGWHSGLCGQFSRTWGLQGTPDRECAAWRSLEDRGWVKVPLREATAWQLCAHFPAQPWHVLEALNLFVPQLLEEWSKSVYSVLTWKDTHSLLWMRKGYYRAREHVNLCVWISGSKSDLLE